MFTEEKIEMMRREVNILNQTTHLIVTFSKNTYTNERSLAPSRPHIMNINGIWYAYTELVPLGYLPRYSGNDLKVIDVIAKGQFPVRIDGLDDQIYNLEVEEAIIRSLNTANNINAVSNFI